MLRHDDSMPGFIGGLRLSARTWGILQREASRPLISLGRPLTGWSASMASDPKRPEQSEQSWPALQRADSDREGSPLVPPVMF